MKGKVRGISRPSQPTQEEANEWYNRAYITVLEAAKLIGQTKQNMMYLIGKGYMESETIAGQLYVPTYAFKRYAISKKKELLDAAGRVLLPINY